MELGICMELCRQTQRNGEIRRTVQNYQQLVQCSPFKTESSGRVMASIVEKMHPESDRGRDRDLRRCRPPANHGKR
uniref:Uncharacterized protein n=1 Tax=Physcomitrium patens TaxID=3218 RepID=A0A2K1K2E6_PHYPA|nr:hypothetical protein PHYPA_012413 [Physcomitrium patens]